ncbi:MAG: cell division protein ZapA [Methylobacteriaceae bacterium]|jgi:cell division protein ZapA|nr:cell division protein ZapA [Methylobacteriaceae bacterium]
MAQVVVTIAGRTYRMACDDGEEARLEHLARDFDTRIAGLRASFGEIGDQRIVVMAALTLADELAEAQRQMGELKERLAEADGAIRSREVQSTNKQDRLASALGEAAQRIERIAHKMRDTSRA